MNTQSLKIKLFIASLIFAVSSYAGTIQQVKNGKVLINFTDDTAQVGDQLFAVNAAGKKTAILEVTTVKNNKAVAKILKGTAQPNDKTEARSSGSAPITSVPTKKESSRSKIIRHDMKKIAVNAKILMDSMSTKQQDDTTPSPLEETVDMAGNNFGLTLSMDYPLNDRYSIRGYAGYEMLKIKATSNRANMCDNRTSRDCNVELSYLSVGGIARMNFNFTQMQLWVGAGASIKQPISKKSTALKLDNIQLANSVIVAGGLDYHINNFYFVPVSAEYHKSFNESDTVPKIQEMAVSVGFGKLF